MTVVAAIARKGHVVMAADTCTNYQGTHVLGARKIARIKLGADEALIAAAGTGALLGLLAHWDSTEAPNPDDAADVQAWAFEASRALCQIAATQEPPLLTSDQEGGQMLDGAYLLGWRGRLIYLFTHQALVLEDGVGALGMGADYAFGFMEAALDHGLDTREPDYGWVVNAAVDGACGRYDGCRVGRDGAQVERLEPA